MDLGAAQRTAEDKRAGVQPFANTRERFSHKPVSHGTSSQLFRFILSLFLSPYIAQKYNLD
jgi:hypothetical protein